MDKTDVTPDQKSSQHCVMFGKFYLHSIHYSSLRKAFNY